MHKPPSSEGSNQCHRCDTEGNTAAVSVVNIHFVKVLEQLFLVTGAQRAGWSLLLKECQDVTRDLCIMLEMTLAII